MATLQKFVALATIVWSLAATQESRAVTIDFESIGQGIQSDQALPSRCGSVYGPPE